MGSKKNNLILVLKGMAMGAADVVPGVSGGTIAFITGIYQELIETINGINIGLFKTWKNEGFQAFWKALNGRFISLLLLGIVISLASLARGITFLLESEPILVWSFFFGLVLASIVVIFKSVKAIDWKMVLFSFLFAFIAYYITTLEPLVNEDASSVFLFLSGALAICAMILPGISGSFILVLLGAYTPVLTAIKDRDFQSIAIVGLGAIVGLLSFARVLKWLFEHFKNWTLMGLIGFIIGSLNKIWPWKEVLTWRINSKGEKVPLLERSIWPTNFDGDAQMVGALVATCAGLLLIIGMERLAKNRA
ncbi:DUF368 domain-containing protein [Flavobacteriaceae bacterium]|nr:DUF368 domain-containing protein [Flavobacteriaceae bacterium]